MGDHSICPKVVAFTCVLAFMPMNFIFDGYSQTQTELNASIEKQSEGRYLMIGSVGKPRLPHKLSYKLSEG